MKSPLTQMKVKKIISEIQQHHRRNGEPVALNELPLWKPLTKSSKIKTGRGFKKMVDAGQVTGVRFAGKRADNHSTYVPTGGSGGSGGGLSGLFGKIFGG